MEKILNLVRTVIAANDIEVIEIIIVLVCISIVAIIRKYVFYRLRTSKRSIEYIKLIGKPPI